MDSPTGPATDALDEAGARARLSWSVTTSVSNPPAPPRPNLFATSRRFFHLSAAERRNWQRAWWRLLVADLALRLRPTRTLERALAEPTLSRSASASEGDALVRAVASAANHHLWPMRCLPRSIALQRLLAARGLAARVRIGVRKEGGKLSAHAWVEVGGQALGEPEPVEARFVPLVEAGEKR